MPLVASVDYPNKRIYLSVETVNTDLDLLDVYREIRALRRTNNAHRNFKPMIEAGGNITKITGVSYTPAYVVLRYGCRIVPYDQHHKIRLIRDTFTDDGYAGRDCFDRTTLTNAVDIDVDFPEREIREVSVGGSTLSAADIWSYANRTLTSGGSGGGATAEEIWSYSNRAITNFAGAADTKISNIQLSIADIPTITEIWTYGARTLTSIDTVGIANAVKSVLDPQLANIATEAAIAAAVEAQLVNEFANIEPSVIAVAVKSLLESDLVKLREIHESEGLVVGKSIAYTDTSISSENINKSVVTTPASTIVTRVS